MANKAELTGREQLLVPMAGEAVADLADIARANDLVAEARKVRRGRTGLTVLAGTLFALGFISAAVGTAELVHSIQMDTLTSPQTQTDLVVGTYNLFMSTLMLGEVDRKTDRLQDMHKTRTSLISGLNGRKLARFAR